MLLIICRLCRFDFAHCFVVSVFNLVLYLHRITNHDNLRKMKKIIFIIIALVVNVNILMLAQPRVPTRVIILTGKGQLTSQSVEVQMGWRGVLLARFNQPIENAIIEILNVDREVAYSQDIDAKTNDALSIELPKNKPGKYTIEIVSPQGILEGEFYVHN